MRNNIVLIDYENVRLATLNQLLHDHFRVVIFVGASQTKLPFEVVDAIQKLGPRGEYVKISGNGSNALDFHIAYYLGVLAVADPTAYFHIVSKDKGFDPLIEHLKTKKIHVGRVNQVADILVVKLASAKSLEERIRLVIEKLARAKTTRPRTMKTLTSSIASLFLKQLLDEEVAEIIAGLEKRGIIAVAGTKVTYAAGDGA